MKHLKGNGLYLLSVLLLDDQRKGFMHLDMLNVLISLTLAFPTLTYPGEDRQYGFGKNDSYVLQLCFVAHFLQIIVGFQQLSEDDQAHLPDSQYSDVQTVERLWKQVATHTGQSSFKLPTNLAAQIKHKMKMFLRMACLFFHFYTDVPLPRQSYEDMCTYLGLPSGFRDIFMTLGMQDIVDKLLQSSKVQRAFVVNFPAQPRRLIDLPFDYMSLIDKASQFRCPSTNSESKNPALCMVCGTIVCSQVRYGSKKSHLSV